MYFSFSYYIRDRKKNLLLHTRIMSSTEISLDKNAFTQKCIKDSEEARRFITRWMTSNALGYKTNIEEMQEDWHPTVGAMTRMIQQVDAMRAFRTPPPYGLSMEQARLILQSYQCWLIERESPNLRNALNQLRSTKSTTQLDIPWIGFTGGDGGDDDDDGVIDFLDVDKDWRNLCAEIDALSPVGSVAEAISLPSPSEFVADAMEPGRGNGCPQENPLFSISNSATTTTTTIGTNTSSSRTSRPHKPRVRTTICGDIYYDHFDGFEGDESSSSSNNGLGSRGTTPTKKRKRWSRSNLESREILDREPEGIKSRKATRRLMDPAGQIGTGKENMDKRSRHRVLKTHVEKLNHLMQMVDGQSAMIARMNKNQVIREERVQYLTSRIDALSARIERMEAGPPAPTSNVERTVIRITPEQLYERLFSNHARLQERQIQADLRKQPEDFAPQKEI